MNRKLRITIVANLNILPYSPDHSGIRQSLDAFKQQGKISDWFIVEPYKYRDTMEFARDIAKDSPDIVLHGMTDSMSLIVAPSVRELLPNTLQIQAMWDYRPKDMGYDGFWDKWRLSGPALNLITLSNKNQLDWWAESFGVETMYWPHGCVVKDKEYDDKYNHDTVFVGSRNESYPYNKRVELIDDINKYTPVTWINQAGGDSHPARIEVWKDLGKIYNSAKTVLDVSHFWDADGYASGRYFYTSGLGACAIAKRFPGCEELFPEGTKIYFDTPEEAAHKIKFYLNNEKERNKIKKAGKEWANKNHTYEVRFKELFKKLAI